MSEHNDALDATLYAIEYIEREAALNAVKKTTERGRLFCG